MPDVYCRRCNATFYRSLAPHEGMICPDCISHGELIILVATTDPTTPLARSTAPGAGQRRPRPVRRGARAPEVVDADLFEATRRQLQDPPRASISALLEMHASEDDVERMIEALPLACEEQSALWLWTWPRLCPANGAATSGRTADTESRRQIVTDRLIALG